MVVAVCRKEGVWQRDILEVDLIELTDKDVKKRNISNVVNRFWV